MQWLFQLALFLKQLLGATHSVSSWGSRGELDRQGPVSAMYSAQFPANVAKSRLPVFSHFFLTEPQGGD